MAIGSVVTYNGFVKQVSGDANRQWDDATAGNIMFCLCSNAYTPSRAHSTTSDLAGIITAGNGAPISATGLSINDTDVAGETRYKSNSADFGSVVTITAKYLVAVMPETAGVFSSSTGKLLFYVDLNTASASSSAIAVDGPFVIDAPASGWAKTVS